jgi:DNA excision repair protein ERCC-8
MLKHIYKRELGLHSSKTLLAKETTKRDYSISYSFRKEIVPTHTSTITKIDLDVCENRFLLSGAFDTSINIFDLEQMHSPGKFSFEPIVNIDTDTVGMHKKAISGLCWYPLDSGMFFTCSIDNTVNVWDTNSTNVIRIFDIEAPVYSIDVSRCALNHTLISAAAEDNMVHLCDIRTGKSIWQLKGHSGKVLETKWSPGQQYTLVSGSEDGSIRLWDVRKCNQSVLTFDQHLDAKDRSKVRKKGLGNIKSHNGAVNGLCFTPDSTRLVSTGTDSTMRCWSVFDGTNHFVNYPGVKNQHQKQRRTSYLAVSQNGELIFHPNDSFVVIYETRTGEVVNTLKNHFKPVTTCVYNPELQHLYTAGCDAQINVWVPQYDEEISKDGEESEPEDNFSDISDDEISWGY